MSVLRQIFGANWTGRSSWAAMVMAMVGALVMNVQSVRADHAVWWVSAMSTQSQTTQVGTTFSEPFSVRLSCVNVDRCLSTIGVNVTFKATTSSGGASGTFTNGTNTVTVQTDSLGIATAPAFTANSVTGSYVVEARAAEPHPDYAIPNVFSLTNSANAATLAADISTGSGSNQSKKINTTFVTPFHVTVFNGSGQLLSGITVTFTAPASGASGTFQNTGTNTTTAVTGATGVATASAFTANGTAGSYFVNATISGTQTATGEELSTPFAVRNTISDVIGVPDLVSASAGNVQGVGVQTTLPTNMQVVILDGNLDYVSGATVVFTVPSTGPSGTFADGSTSYTTTSGDTGLATASAFTTNAEVGQIQMHVVATKNGVSAETILGIINGKVDTTTTVAINPANGSVYGQPVVVTATVRPVRGTYVPTGPVSFKKDGTLIPSCSSVSPSGGVATCTFSGLDNTDESTWLATGTYSFSAEYAGDAVSIGSVSTGVSHTVSKASTTMVLETSHPDFVLHEESVTFTASVSPIAPGRGTIVGSVTFTSSDGTLLNGGNPIQVIEGIAQVNTSELTPGTHTITAIYSGGTNFHGSNDTLSQNVYTIPEVTQDPESTLVLVGQQASFSAAATAVPDPNVQWQVSTDGGTTFEVIPGATTTTWSFFPAGDDDQNQYRAVFTNPAGSDTSSAATLTVRQPPSFTSAAATTFSVGEEDSFSVTAEGILAPSLSLTSGELPEGVTFDSATGLLGGTPADESGGAYP
ncbi:MAG: Ig-like domain repeat protein, partial [Chloroflexota bacterium]|nr:Ig-like domain repeat protein [Chloroflexota bacterium]